MIAYACSCLPRSSRPASQACLGAPDLSCGRLLWPCSCNHLNAPTCSGAGVCPIWCVKLSASSLLGPLQAWVGLSLFFWLPFFLLYSYSPLAFWLLRATGVSGFLRFLALCALYVGTVTLPPAPPPPPFLLPLGAQLSLAFRRCRPPVSWASAPPVRPLCFLISASFFFIALSLWLPAAPPPSRGNCFVGVVALPLVVPCPLPALLFLRAVPCLLSPPAAFPPPLCCVSLVSFGCRPFSFFFLCLWFVRLLAARWRLSLPVPSPPLRFVFRGCWRPAPCFPLFLRCFFVSARLLAVCWRIALPAALSPSHPRPPLFFAVCGRVRACWPLVGGFCRLSPPPPPGAYFLGIGAAQLSFSYSVSSYLFCLAVGRLMAVVAAFCPPPPPSQWCVFCGCHRPAIRFLLLAPCMCVSACLLAVVWQFLPPVVR